MPIVQTKTRALTQLVVDVAIGEKADKHLLYYDLTTGFWKNGTVDAAGLVAAASLYDSNGKIKTAHLPSLAIGQKFVVSSEAAMLALVAEIGDVASRSDTDTVYLLTDSDPTLLASWTPLEASAVNVDEKADKVVAAVSGNFASLNAQGNLVDSGYSFSSFPAPDHTHDDRYYTEAEVTTFLAGKQAVGSYAITTNNLSDLANAGTARTNLGLGSAAILNTGTSSGQIPVLGSGGKLSSSLLPSIAIGETFTVGSQVAMTALIAENGDVAIRTDLASRKFVLTGGNATVPANWIEIGGSGNVISVNGQTGAVVLDKSHVGLSSVTNALQLVAASNLSDLTNVGTARMNLGLAIGVDVPALSHTHTVSNISDFAEAVDDRVDSLLVAGSNVTVTYDDVSNTLTIASTGGGGGSSPGGTVDGAIQFKNGTSLGAYDNLLATASGFDFEFVGSPAPTDVAFRFHNSFGGPEVNVYYEGRVGINASPTADGFAVYGNSGNSGYTHTTYDESGLVFGVTAGGNLRAKNHVDPIRVRFGSALGSTVVQAETSPPIVMLTSGTIVKWWIHGDVSGTVTVDVKKNGVSITGTGTKPNLLVQQSSSGTSFTGWSGVDYVEGDVFELVAESGAINVKEIVVVLKAERK